MSFIDDNHRSKPLFPRGPGVVLRALLLAAICVALMVRDAREPPLSRTRELLASAAYPLIWLAAVPGRMAVTLGQVKGRRQLQAENESLRDQQQLQAARLQRMAALAEENRRLRRLLSTALRLEHRAEAAEVVAVNQDPYIHQLVINRGSGEGVYRGQAVLDAEGIIGQVVEVHPGTALVLLISDPSHGLPVENTRTGLQTIAQGLGDGERLRLPFLPGNADIDVGDLLVSSPLGGRFPGGYPVGRVVEVRQRPGETFKEAIAEPFAGLGRHRQVLLVWVDGAEPGAAAEPTPSDAAATDAAP